MCILDNIDSIKSYGRENLYLKPEWDAPKGSGEKKKINIWWNGKKCQECNIKKLRENVVFKIANLRNDTEK